jgi:hypothetical protein
MANPTLQKTTLNTVDVSTSVLSWNVKESLDLFMRTATSVFKNTFDSVLGYPAESTIGNEIIFERGVALPTEQRLFRGYVRAVERQSGKVRITCEDKLSLAKYKVLNQTFNINSSVEAGVVSEIFKTVCGLCGLTADNTSVQSSGTVDVVKIFRFRQRAALDGLRELAEYLDWQFYYNPVDDKVYFEPKGYRNSSTVLTVGDNVVKMPKWNIDSTQLYNRITVVGSATSYFTTEGPHKLDGTTINWSTSSITLGQAPEDTIKLLCDTSATPTTQKVGGISGSTSNPDFYVDKTRKLITFSSTFVPTTSYYATVQYNYLQPIVVTRQNTDSITQYTGGIAKEITQQRDDIQTLDDAMSWAAGQLWIYSTPFTTCDSICVREQETLQVGWLYPVVDTYQNVNETLMIKAASFTYPYSYDEVAVSNQEYRLSNWGLDKAQRLKRLEENQAADTQIVTTVEDVNTSTTFENVYLKVQWRDTTPDPIYDRAGTTYDSTFYYSESYTNALATTYLMPGNAKYDDYLVSDRFYDSSSSSGVTFDTIAKTITITAYMTSYPVMVGTIPTAVTLMLGSVTGDYTFEISADGKSTWQTLTPNVRTVLSSANTTGVYYKITKNSGTSVVIANSYNTNGTFNVAGISLRFEI